MTMFERSEGLRRLLASRISRPTMWLSASRSTVTPSSMSTFGDFDLSHLDVERIGFGIVLDLHRSPLLRGSLRLNTADITTT